MLTNLSISFKYDGQPSQGEQFVIDFISEFVRATEGLFNTPNGQRIVEDTAQFFLKGNKDVALGALGGTLAQMLLSPLYDPFPNPDGSRPDHWTETTWAAQIAASCLTDDVRRVVNRVNGQNNMPEGISVMTLADLLGGIANDGS